MKDSILADTHELKELLVKSKDTGIIAWQIGKVAKNVKENDSYRSFKNGIYKNFSAYTEAELNAKSQTINTYIEIFDKFPNPDEITNLLVSHLKEIVKIKDNEIRKIATQAFKKVQKKSLKSTGKITKSNSFTVTEVRRMVKLLKYEKSLNKNDVDEIINEFYSLKMQADTKVSVNKIGIPMKFPLFPTINQIFEYQPRNEQGTVGLFCLIFSLLKEYEFEIEINRYSKLLKFDSIRFIREEFPDASIICALSNNRKERRELMTEFEFKSSNYIDHLYSRDVCHLIICWENDVHNRKMGKNVLQYFPPIFSLKDFLENNKIEIKKAVEKG